MPVPGALKILIVGAEDLDKLVTVGEQEPYYLLECGNQRSKSKPCRENGRNPKWNTAHKFTLADEMVAKVIIKDDVTKGIIGEALIDLGRARNMGKDDSATPLTNLGGQQRGLLYFKLKFTPDPNAAPSAARSPQAAQGTSGGGWGPSTGGAGSLGSPRMSRGSTAGGAAVGKAGSAATDDDAAAVRHPYQDVLQSSMRQRGNDNGDGVQDDPTMQSVNTKVSLAKQAMQQLTAELAELSGGSGIDAVPPPQVQSSRNTKSTGGHPAGSSGAGDAALYRTRSAAAGAVVEREFGAPSSTTSSSRLGSFGHHEQQQQQQHYHHHAGPPEAQSPQSTFPRPADSISSPAGRGLYDTPRGGGTGSLKGSVRGDPLLATDDLIRLYTGKAPSMSHSGDMLTQKLLIQELTLALEAAHAEKVTLEDELGSVKQTMAVMSSQHYKDIQRLKQSGPGTHPSPPSPAGNGIASMLSMKGSRVERRISSIGLYDHSQGGRGVDGEAPGEGLGGTSTLERDDTWDNGSGGGDSPMAAHRLEVKVMRLERQLAEQVAKNAESEKRLEYQGTEMAALRDDLEKAEELARKLDKNSKAMADSATVVNAARQEALEAAKAMKEAQEREAGVAAELDRVRSVLTATLAEKAELEEALGLMERNTKDEVERLQSAVTKAQQEAEALRQGNVEVAKLQEQLAQAREEAEGLKNQHDDVEILQQQLRRSLRQVVELQHQVQLLQSQQPAPSDDATDVQRDEATINELELLMQELVQTKIECAELKEQQLVTQRQLFKAQETIREGSQGGVSALRQSSVSGA